MSFALKQNAPCKGCENRHSKCHTTCPDYIEWSEAHKEIKNNAIKQKNMERDMFEFQMSGAVKVNRRHR